MQQAVRPHAHLMLPQRTYDNLLNVSAVQGGQEYAFMNVQLGQATEPAKYGQSVKLLMTLQSIACNYILSYRDRGQPNGQATGQAYQIIVIYPNGTSISSAVSSSPAISVTSTAPNPVNVTVWVMAAGSSNAGVAVGGVLS